MKTTTTHSLHTAGTTTTKERNNDMEQFKAETLSYLKSKGYDLPWDDVVRIHERSARDLRTTLENEINSCLTVDDDKIDAFIVDEMRRVCGQTRISLKKEPHAFEMEPFWTVGTLIDPNWKISELNEDQLNDIKFRLKKASDFLFHQFDEMDKDHPDTDLDFIYEYFEEIHSEMGALLLILMYKADPESFEINPR